MVELSGVRLSFLFSVIVRKALTKAVHSLLCSGASFHCWSSLAALAGVFHFFLAANRSKVQRNSLTLILYSFGFKDLFWGFLCLY